MKVFEGLGVPQETPYKYERIIAIFLISFTDPHRLHERATGKSENQTDVWTEVGGVT